MRQVLPVVPAKHNPHDLIFKSCKSLGWLKYKFYLLLCTFKSVLQYNVRMLIPMGEIAIFWFQIHITNGLNCMHRKWHPGNQYMVKSAEHRMRSNLELLPVMNDKSRPHYISALKKVVPYKRILSHQYIFFLHIPNISASFDGIIW
jgi:hypothetical protein